MIIPPFVLQEDAPVSGCLLSFDKLRAVLILAIRQPEQIQAGSECGDLAVQLCINGFYCAICLHQHSAAQVIYAHMQVGGTACIPDADLAVYRIGQYLNSVGMWRLNGGIFYRNHVRETFSTVLRYSADTVVV